MWKSRFADAYPGDRAMDMLEQQLAHGRWAPRETADHGIDCGIAQLREEVRLPVVEGAFGVVGIQHGVELGVGHRPDGIQDGRSELFQRPHGFFGVRRRAAMTGDQRGYLCAGPVGCMRQRREQRVLVGKRSCAVPEKLEHVT